MSYTPSEEGLYNLKVTTDQNTDAIITSTLKVADNETIAIDGITYLCTPDYHRAKVIKDEDADRSLNTANILSTVSANGKSPLSHISNSHVTYDVVKNYDELWDIITKP